MKNDRVTAMAKQLGVGLALGLAVIVSGCASQAPFEMKWRAEKNFDAFADHETCRVTTWLAREGQAGFRQANRLYPVIEKRGTSILVGVMTAPIQAGANLIAAPTGDIQIKVDGQPTWTIAAVETPPEVQQGTSSQVIAQNVRDQMQAALKNNPYVDGKAMGDMNMMGQISAMTSPRTMATGEKAAQILAQIKQGKSVSYRKVTGGTVTSEPVTFQLEGVNSALAECGL